MKRIALGLFLILMVSGISAFGQARKSSRSLTVLTAPDASVWLDGVFRGTAVDGKLVMKIVLPGAHSLKVRAFGFKEVTRPIGAGETQVSIPLEKTLDRAEIAFQNAEKQLSEDKSKAIELYEEALRLNPKYMDALIGLARASSDEGDYAGAHAAIKKARLIKPLNAEASTVEGRIYKSEGEIDKAIDSFERAIREGKGFQPEAYTGLALIFKEEAETAASSSDYELEKLNYEEAVGYFEKAIDQLSGTEPVVYLLLGQIYEKTKQNPKAIAVYERFLRDCPDHEERPAVESFIVQLKKPAPKVM
ncbi:MAG: tetratricopeptide repeat protein [Pyrinomonadaceae bacterium]